MDYRRIQAWGIPFWPVVALIATLILGTIAGAMYPYPEWGMVKRAAFGGFMGGFCGFILTFWRLMR